MAPKNRLWGAERIRGELLKIGIWIPDDVANVVGAAVATCTWEATAEAAAHSHLTAAVELANQYG